MKKIILTDSILMRSSAVLSVVVALLLIGIKSIVLKRTGSFSIEASLLDSVLDVIVSLINLYAIRQALKPPSYHYRFGYGKAEALAGLVQSIMIILSAFWLLSERVIFSDAVKEITLQKTAFLGTIVSTMLTLSLILWQRFILKRVKSLTIAADNLHFETDIYVDLGLLFTFICIYFTQFYSLDTIFGVLALTFILYKTYPILRQSFDVLMDRELSDIIRKDVIYTVLKNNHIKNIHQLKTRSLGQSYVIQFHIVLDPTLTLFRAHEITHQVEDALLLKFPKAHIIIHQDCYQDEDDNELS